MGWIPQVNRFTIQEDVISGIYVVTVIVDMSKANIKELIKAGLASEDTILDYISLKASVKELEKLGLSCEKK